MGRPIPEGFHTIQTELWFKDGRKAVEFYKKAFGAIEKFSMPGPRGKGLLHAELRIGDSALLVADEMSGPQGGRSAESYGGSPVAYYLYVDDVDASFKKAVAAGAKVIEGVSDKFWGDRVGVLKDPFGLTWSLATHVKDLSPEELRKAADEALAHMAGT